ncbi:hypothetical protein Tco_0759695 [Tanacetum coccineum]
MAQLKYCDKHNQVGFLRKPDESAGFAEIVDFLRGSNLRYALTTNPTIYDSLVRQFWQSATANTKADGSLEINATIDTIRYTISEASIRDSLQLEDATGITMLPNDALFEGMGQIGSKSGGWDQFGSNIATALICLSTVSLEGEEMGRVLKRRKLGFVRLWKRKNLSGGRGERGDSRRNVRMILLFCSTRMVIFFNKRKASREEQVEDISPNTLEAANALKLPFKDRSIDKGRRLQRRKEAKGKKVSLKLGFQDESDAGAEQVQYCIVTVGAKKSSDQDKGQREGKAPMISEETPKKSKEQVLPEEASLTEAIRLDTLQKEEVAKQVHLDSILAQRIAEEEELNEQQKEIRKAQVQFEAQHYTNEDWDLIRAKIEANAELSKSMLGSELQGEDFAKKMVDLVNQRKKYFTEERARAKRNKPMTQSQDETYMMNYLKNQGTWKLSQLKSLSFEEIKKEFDKLVKQVESFAPINFEATKASFKKNLVIRDSGQFSKRLRDDEEYEVVCKKESVTGTKLHYLVLYGDGPEDELERVHCLNLESMDVYMLIERTYPLSAEMCKAMLDKKLQGGKPDENLLTKMLNNEEKQAGFRKKELRRIVADKIKREDLKCADQEQLEDSKIYNILR